MLFEFFGMCAELRRAIGSNDPYPWMFRIHHPERGWIEFYGIPNRCETWRSAMMRAWWRCRWISDGTFDVRYKAGA